MNLKNLLTGEKLMFGIKIAFLDILYYLIFGAVIYLGFAWLNHLVPSIMDSASTFADLGLIENQEAISPQNAERYINAAKVIESVQNYLLVFYIGLWIFSSLLAALIKSREYAMLSKKRYTLKYFGKSLVLNILWRGIFFGLFLLSLAIIKPEMMLAFWLLIIGIFLYFSPGLYLSISEEKNIFAVLAGSIGKSIKKIHMILLDYLILAIVILILFLLLKFLPLPIFLLAFAVSAIFFISGAKIVLSELKWE